MKQRTAFLERQLPGLAFTRRHFHFQHGLSKPTMISGQTSSISDPLSVSDQNMRSKPCLGVLPFSTVLRSYLITTATSSPILLRASFAALKKLLDPDSRFLSVEHNPVIKAIFKKTFYAQFCAGETSKEVQQTIKELKETGYSGVILEYALEVLKGEKSGKSTAEDIETWRKGVVDSIRVCSPGDFVGLKWSGLGTKALELLDEGKTPTPEMERAMVEACDLAAEKKVALLPAAELEVTNVGIDSWTLNLQRRYNKTKPGTAIIYTTYQAYLRSTPRRLARDLAAAQREGFTLGIKLVRGAYLQLEPKSAVMSDKEETNAAYDSILEALLRRQYNGFLQPVESKEFPNVALMIATHNAQSISKAQEIRNEQAEKNLPRIECGYAQLQGMADEISCELAAVSQVLGTEKASQDIPRTFKCSVWGTIGQCLNFLYRRALENQDAASRTRETRDAMGRELWRRFKGMFGVADRR